MPPRNATRRTAMQPDIDAIEARANAATPGPWWVQPERQSEHSGLLDAYIAYGTPGVGSETYDLYEAYNVDTDYVFMAAARTDVPNLIAALRASQAQSAALLADVARLNAERDRMATLLDEAIAVIVDSDRWDCIACSEPIGYGHPHTADCLITRARGAVGETGR